MLLIKNEGNFHVYIKDFNGFLHNKDEARDESMISLQCFSVEELLTNTSKAPLDINVK